MKFIKITAIALSAIALLGCEQDRKMANPSIENIGTIDGCTVRWVDRGYTDKSFYIARCDNTTTVTSSSGGKYPRPIGAITLEIKALEK